MVRSLGALVKATIFVSRPRDHFQLIRASGGVGVPRNGPLITDDKTCARVKGRLDVVLRRLGNKDIALITEQEALAIHLKESNTRGKNRDDS